jgi:hypothetical protein
MFTKLDQYHNQEIRTVKPPVVELRNNKLKEVNGTTAKCRVYTVHEWLTITVFVLLESK